MRKYRNYIFLGLVLLLTLKVFIPQLDELKDSLAALKDANPAWIITGIIVYFTGIPVLTLQYMSLALKKIKFGLTFKVEMATLFVSKLLPSSLGTISLNMYYMVKMKHTSNQAVTVMTMNAITSSIAYLGLIIIALSTSYIDLAGLRGKVDIPTNLILFLLILFFGAAVVIFRSITLRSKINRIWTDLRKNLVSYKKRPRSVLISIICNGLGSFTSLFGLYASAQAVGVNLSLAEALLAYTFGNIACALVPTPGGLGAAEAGIYSGLVLTGMAGPDAIVITLLYRLITYWLPIAPGYYFFWGLRKNILSEFSYKKHQNA